MNVCSSFVGNSQKLYKQSKYSSTRQCSGILLTTKKEYELLIQDTSMNLKKIRLSKKSQTQRVHSALFHLYKTREKTA